MHAMVHDIWRVFFLYYYVGMQNIIVGFIFKQIFLPASLYFLSPTGNICDPCMQYTVNILHKTVQNNI